MVGRPGQPDPTKTEAEAADEAMNRLREQQEARNAAIFNTFIQTCKQVGVPFMSYFKKVMNELKNGRTDYQNLLPATIQI